MSGILNKLSLKNLAIVGIGILLVVTLVASVNSIGTVQLNEHQSCDDPFEGEGRPRFNTGYWDLTDFCIHSVPYSEIRSGGPPPDGIPPIDTPVFDSITDAADWLQPQSPVLVFELDGDARAYPLAIMTRHEIVNDNFDDVPVAVTYCPLCNSGIVFDRRIDGETLRLGVSGNLRNSDMVMWDDVTESWWQQFTGEGIVGAYTGRQLTILPSTMASFGAFSEQFPDGTVLSPSSGARSYGSNPYTNYDRSTDPFLYDGELDRRLRATERVLAGVIDGVPMAYPFSALQEERVINDALGDREIVAFWQPGATTALGATDIDSAEDVGMAALYHRELEGQVLTFIVDTDGNILDEETGSIWNVFGTAISGNLAGSQLRQELAGPHFWFAWAAFKPDTALYGFDSSE